jgi:hypothetical protein
VALAADTERQLVTAQPELEALHLSGSSALEWQPAKVTQTRSS